MEHRWKLSKVLRFIHKITARIIALFHPGRRDLGVTGKEHDRGGGPDEESHGMELQGETPSVEREERTGQEYVGNTARQRLSDTYANFLARNRSVISGEDTGLLWYDFSTQSIQGKFDERAGAWAKENPEDSRDIRMSQWQVTFWGGPADGLYWHVDTYDHIDAFPALEFGGTTYLPWQYEMRQVKVVYIAQEAGWFGPVIIMNEFVSAEKDCEYNVYGVGQFKLGKAQDDDE